MSEHLHHPEQLTAQEILASAQEFLSHFQIKADPVGEADVFQAALKELNPRYKEGRTLVRWELEADQTAWPEETLGVIERAATSMNMLKHETPLAGQFDAVIVLGAARQAPKDRTLYAVNAVAESRATVGQIIAVGSARKLKEAEQEAVANYAPTAQTEADLMVAAANLALAQAPEVPVRVIQLEEEKANTAFVVKAALSTLQAEGRLPENARIGAVTTQIYQAASQLDVQRAAKEFGIDAVYTAGNPSDPAVVAKRTPATYLSEVARTLTAASKAGS